MGKYHISMVSVAIPMAAKAFVGKTDKTGREGAILHSLRVYDTVRGSQSHDEIAQAAALLHDTIEDTHITEADIRSEFAAYPAEDVEALVSAVLSVTRGYIRRGTQEMVFSPPPAEQVCDCDFRKGRCQNPAHVYDKEKYRHFVERSKRHPRGRYIKIADITDNMSESRVEGLSEEEKGIVEERYVPAMAFLRDQHATIFYTPRQLARLCVHCQKPFNAHEGDDRLCPRSGQGLMFGETRTKFKGVK